MIIDITVRVTPKMMVDAQGQEKKALVGHIGTHFDVMNQEFPLEYAERKGIVFDVSAIADRDIALQDVDMHMVEKDMFVAFYTGYIERVGYGSSEYFSMHPQLSGELLEALLQKGISILGIDFAGVRRGKEHTPMDQHYADKGAFIIENLCNLHEVLQGEKAALFQASTYPMHFAEMTGLPCRVLARI